MIIKNLFQLGLKIYDSPDNMPLSNFIKYLETNDSKYFTKQLKYHKSLEKTVIPNFFKQYEQLTKDKNITERIEKMSEIVFLSVKYDTVNMLINTARNFSKLMPIEQFKEIISMLEKWDYKISIDKDVFEQLEKINNRIKGIKTKIDMLSSEIKVEDKKESININSTLIDISRVLELKYQLKANELTVSEWIEYKKQAEKDIEERNKKES